LVLYFVGAQLLMPSAITLDSYSESHHPICATKPVDAILLGQFRQRHLLADRFKCNLGLELRRVVLSFLHFGSLLSSCDPA